MGSKVARIEDRDVRVAVADRRLGGQRPRDLVFDAALARVLAGRRDEALAVADEDAVADVLADARLGDAALAGLDGEHVDRKHGGERLAELAKEEPADHARRRA